MTDPTKKVDISRFDLSRISNPSLSIPDPNSVDISRFDMSKLSGPEYESYAKPESMSGMEAFFGSLGDELTFGMMYDNPNLDSDKLSVNAKIGKALGQGVGFFGWTVLATVATGGLGGIAMLASTGSKLKKGSDMYKAAKALKAVTKTEKLAKQEALAEAISVAGIGVKNPNLIKNIGFNGPKKAHIDKFFRLVDEEGVSAARRYTIGREMKREAAIWGMTGQLTVEEDASLKERAAMFGQDIVAGSLFALAPAMRYRKAGNAITKGILNKPKKALGLKTTKEILKKESSEDLKKTAFSEVGMYFGAGAMLAQPDQFETEGAEVGTRIATGVLTAMLGKFFGGASLTVAKQDAIRAMQRVGITDEKQLSTYAGISEALLNKNVIEMVDEQFKGIDFYSYKGGAFSKQGTRAKVKKVFIDDESGKLKIEYDTFQGKSDTIKNKGIIEDFDTFTLGKKNKAGERLGAKYKQADENKVQEVLNNLQNKDGDLVRHSWFKSQKDIKNLIEKGKFGIITGSNPGHRGAGTLIGETANEKVVRELLARGYDSNNMMSLDGKLADGVNGMRIIVKDLAERDAIDIAKLMGQETVVTQKGLLNIARIKGTKGNEIDSVTYQKLDWKFGSQAEAQKQGWYMATAPSKNSSKLAIHWNAQGDASSIKNPLLSKAFKFKKVDEVMEYSARKNLVFTTNTMEKIQLIRVAQELEVAQGLKSVIGSTKKNQAHEALKTSLFGVNSMKQMSIKQLETYASLLKADRNLRVKFKLENQATLFGQNITNPNWLQQKMIDFTDWKQIGTDFILPINTKYGRLGKILGSSGLLKIKNDLTNMVVYRDKLKGAYEAMRESQRLVTKKLSTESIDKLDKNLLYFIDKRASFKGLRPELSKKEHNAMLLMVDSHKKYMNDMFAMMKKAGVKEKVWNPSYKNKAGKVTGRYEYRPITKVEDFVSLTLTDEAAKLFRAEGDNSLVLINHILANDERFIKNGIYSVGKVSQKKRLELAEEIYESITTATQQKGMFGAQYSRMGKFPPKYYVDTEGNIIDGVKNMNLKAGDMIGKKKIGKVVDFYEPDYAKSMDRYGSRAANITASTQYFGHTGAFKRPGSTEFSENLTKRWRQIESEMGSDRRAKAYIKKELSEDLDFILHGNGYDELTGALSNSLVSTTAALGLSSPISAMKNLLLGNVQLASTYGFVPLLKTWYQIGSNPRFQKAAFKKARESGALGASQALLETALVPKTGYKQKLTYLMERAEYLNRLVAVSTGDMVAQDALRVLRNKPTKMMNIEKSVARRLLGESLELSDEQVIDAIQRGNFSQKALDKIYFMAHSSTQGLADPVFMPKIMGNKYVKPFTLFYRIAYRIQENIYKNAYRPLIDNNEIAPMGRYIAGTMAAGAALEHTLFNLFNTDPEVFKDEGNYIPMERLMGYFMTAEGAGLASNIISGQRGGAVTPAIVSMPLGIYETISNLAKESAAIPEGAQGYGVQKAILKSAGRDIAKSIPGMNFIVKAIQSNITKIDYNRYEQIRNKQREYKRDINNKVSMSSFNQGVTKTTMYKQLQATIYSDLPGKKKLANYEAALRYVQYQYESSNRGRVSKEDAYFYARKIIVEYLKDTRPITLSTKLSGGKDISDKEDFLSRLPKEQRKEIKDMEKLWKQNYQEYLYIINSAQLKP